MSTFSHNLEERLLDLGWSLWTALGVPGQLDHHGDCAIDPEPLILFSAGLGDADPRLRDEVTDWCIRYGQLISGTRLRNLLPEDNDELRAHYGELAATLAQCSSLRWPAPTVARQHVPRDRSSLQAFVRPSQLSMRLRAVLGVGARADIVQVFLSRPDAAFGAADLAAETGFMKRSVAQTLETFRLGGLLQAFPVRNQLHFRLPLGGAEHLAQQFAPMPTAFVRWSAVLPFLTAALKLARKTESQSDAVRSVEAHAFVVAEDSTLRVASLPAPPRDVTGPLFWNEFAAWLMTIVDNLAAGNEPATDRFKIKWTHRPSAKPGEEDMEHGDFCVWEDSSAAVDRHWVLGLSDGTQELEPGVRYATNADAKRAAERRQFAVALDQQRRAVG